MASKFQSRLVGTIILVAVGVIVLPDILDGKKLHYKDEFASIPIKPELNSDTEQFEVMAPVDDTLSLPASPVQATVESTSEPAAAKPKAVPVEHKTTSTVKKAVSKPQPVAVTVKPVAEPNHYQDSAWMIQLVALKNTDNAKKLVKDLQKRGYQAHLKQEKSFSRVIIGPDVSKSKLEQQLDELEKISGSRGRLLKFRPLNP